MPRPYTKKAAGRPKLTRVRCLGPGPEHQFGSPDPTHIRICKACRDRRVPRLAETMTAWTWE